MKDADGKLYRMTDTENRKQDAPDVGRPESGATPESPVQISDSRRDSRRTAPAIRFERVKFGYGREPLFCEFNLEITEGDFLGVIGPNGAGKTTLLRLAAGLLRPSAGVVRLFGRSIADSSRRAIARRVAVVPQESHFAFDYPVEDVVLMGRNPWLGRMESPSKKDYGKVAEALEFVDAARLRHKSVNQVSAGEKQRVVLARALAQEPDVLLLDEAMSHLDLAHQASLLTILRQLNRQGKTIVLLAHDLNLAALACNRILLLAAGRRIAYDTPDRVITGELVRSVYGVESIVVRHPDTGVPQVMMPAAYNR